MEFNYLFTSSFIVAYTFTNSTGQLQPRGLNSEKFNYHIIGYFTGEKSAKTYGPISEIFLSSLAPNTPYDNITFCIEKEEKKTITVK